MKLLVKNKNNKKRKISEVVGITRDGWVIGKDGAFGDNGEDCEIFIDTKDLFKDFRKNYGLSQQEMAWILGIGRTTYLVLERGEGREITLKEFMILSSYIEKENGFSKLKKELLKD